MQMLSLVPFRRRPWLGYPVAIVLSLLSIWWRIQLGPMLDGFPFLVATITVVIVGFLCGFGPGMLTAAICGVFAKYNYIPPIGSLALSWPEGWIAVGFYILLSLLITGLLHRLFALNERQRATEADLRRLTGELEQRVADRTASLKAEMAERSAAQAQLRQLQKMESVGQLTGGIAHDFNNMLAIIIGSLDLARRKLTGAEDARIGQCIDSAAEGAQRAAVLTARLLAFSRQQPLAPQALDANKLVAGMSELLRRTIGEHIRVETVLAGGLWHAFADPAQLENALVNLAVNARDAMPAGGRLTIETANADLDDRYARAHSEVKPGQYVLISVTDSGSGMAADVLERAFDPFYTTKDVGKGTGLGLSQVYGYIKQSGGHVKIYSEIEQGTTVKIYLPRHLGRPVDAGSRSAAEGLATGSPEQIVLVVEDEDQVRRMTVEALRELGYTVIQAAGPSHALEQIAVQPRIDLLFTDIVMPDMNGRELADRAREGRPDLRVLFTTGYTRNAVVHNGMLDPGVAFLPKPFTVEQLAIKVHEVIAGGGGAERA